MNQFKVPGKEKKFIRLIKDIFRNPIKRKRLYLIASFAFLGIFIYFFLQTTITGNVIFNDPIEQQVENQSERIREIEKIITAENENSLGKEDFENLREFIRINAQVESEFRTRIEEILDDRAQLEATIDGLESQRDSLYSIIRSSVVTICCSLGDVKDGSNREWGINNGIISCNGDFTVNCGTGETDFV